LVTSIFFYHRFKEFFSQRLGRFAFLYGVFEFKIFYTALNGGKLTISPHPDFIVEVKGFVICRLYINFWDLLSIGDIVLLITTGIG
jgi:hypothetical protein